MVTGLIVTTISQCIQMSTMLHATNEYNTVCQLHLSLKEKRWNEEGLKEFGTEGKGARDSLAGKVERTLGALGLIKNWCWLLGWVRLCLSLGDVEPVLEVENPRPPGWLAGHDSQNAKWIVKSKPISVVDLLAPSLSSCFALRRQFQLSIT